MNGYVSIVLLNYPAVHHIALLPVEYYRFREKIFKEIIHPLPTNKKAQLVRYVKVSVPKLSIIKTLFAEGT